MVEPYVSSIKKRNTEVYKAVIPEELIELLGRFKETQEWKAIKQLMKIIIEERKTIAFHLNEDDPNFVNKHARETAYSYAFNALIQIIDKDVRRESQK